MNIVVWMFGKKIRVLNQLKGVASRLYYYASVNGSISILLLDSLPISTTISKISFNQGYKW